METRALIDTAHRGQGARRDRLNMVLPGLGCVRQDSDEAATPRCNLGYGPSPPRWRGSPSCRAGNPTNWPPRG